MSIIGTENRRTVSPKIKTKIYKKILNPKNWKQFVYDTIRGIYGQKAWNRQWKAFDQFITEELLDNDRRLIGVDGFECLHKDAYILGSDQIWSSFLTGKLDPVYFGEFKKKEKNYFLCGKPCKW